MIYLILFGLDFYSNLVKLLTFFSIIVTITGVIGTFLHFVLYSEATSIRDEETIIRKFLLFGSYIVNRRWYILSLISITFLMPAPKTVVIAAGLYAGEQVVTYIQDSPLAKKAYQLAEKKIDELLEETKTKEEGKK